MPVALIAGLFSRPRKATPVEVADHLRNFLEGTGGPYDWDDFTSVPIAHPALEAIRVEAIDIPLPMDSDGEKTLRALLARAEAINAGATGTY